VLQAATGRYQGKQTGENSLLRTLRATYQPADALVLDRYFSGWLDIALLADNLIRHTLATAAFAAGVQPWRISFKGTLQTLNQFLPNLHSAASAEGWLSALLAAIATHNGQEKKRRPLSPTQFPGLNTFRGNFPAAAGIQMSSQRHNRGAYVDAPGLCETQSPVTTIYRFASKRPLERRGMPCDALNC
jgi:hypothetical protein